MWTILIATALSALLLSPVHAAKGDWCYNDCAKSCPREFKSMPLAKCLSDVCARYPRSPCLADPAPRKDQKKN